MDNTLCFFEIPADDLESLKEFYSAMFGWTFEKMPGDFKYYRIETGVDVPKGGLVGRQDPHHHTMNYIKVGSMSAALAKATGLGATVIVPKKPVPGIGWYAVLMDPQRNVIGLWEDDAAAG